jgi:hypothetical protein
MFSVELTTIASFVEGTRGFGCVEPACRIDRDEELAAKAGLENARSGASHKAVGSVKQPPQ